MNEGEERHSEVLGGLPRSRPHRRSDKRASTRPAASEPTTDGAPRAPGPVETTPEPSAEYEPASRRPGLTPKPKAKPAARKPKAASAAKKATPRSTAAPKARATTASEAKATASEAKTTASEAKAATPSSGPTRLRQPKQPGGTPSRGPAKPHPAARTPVRTPSPPKGGEILGTAVQAAAELAEIGLSAGARALRRAVSHLPRP
jgi:hypothetical protein